MGFIWFDSTRLLCESSFMKTALFCDAAAEVCRCMSQCSGHGSSASSYCCYLWSCPPTPGFRYRIASMSPRLSMFAGYWKRPVSGSWGPLAIGEQWLCSSNWPDHLSLFILVHNKISCLICGTHTMGSCILPCLERNGNMVLVLFDRSKSDYGSVQ